MRRGILTAFFFGLMLWPSFAQGLNVELGFNDHNYQEAKDVLIAEEYTFLLRDEWTMLGQQRSYLSKIDTNGQTEWNVQLMPHPAEIVDARKMMRSEKGGVYITGFVREVCDVGGGCYWFLMEILPDGTDYWSKIWVDLDCYSSNSSAIHQSGDTTIWVTTYFNAGINGTFIRGSDSLGYNTTGYGAGFNDIKHLTSMPGFELIGADDNTIYNYSNSSVVSSINITGPIRDLETRNDTLYVLTADSIFEFNDTLGLIGADNVPGTNDYDFLSLGVNTISFASRTATEVTVFTLDNSLQVINSKMILVDDANQFKVAFSNEHMSVARTFNLFDGTAVQYQDYSLLSNVSVDLDRTDVGITNLIITDIATSQDSNFPDLFSMELWGSVTLTNFGPDTLHSCIVNNFISQGIACGEWFYKESFSGLNLPPGDSVVLDLGLFYAENNFFGQGNSVYREFCPFTSYANELTDLVVGNDAYCNDFFLGVANMTEVSIEDKEIMKMFDLLGREVQNPRNEMVVVLFSDGSTEKMFAD